MNKKYYLFFLISIFLSLFIIIFLSNKVFGAEIGNTSDFSDCDGGIMYPPLSYSPPFSSNRLVYRVFLPDPVLLSNFTVKASFYSSRYSEGNTTLFIVNKNGENLFSSSYFPSDWLDFVVASSTSNVSYSTTTTFSFNNVLLPSGYNFFYFFAHPSVGYGLYGKSISSDWDDIRGEYETDDDLHSSFSLYNAWYGSKDLCFIMETSPFSIDTQINIEKPSSSSQFFENIDFSNFYKINFYLNESDINPIQDDYVSVGYTLFKKINNNYTTVGFKEYKIFFNNLNVPGWNSIFLDSPSLLSGDYRVIFYLKTDQDIFTSDGLEFSILSSFYSSTTTSTINFNPETLINEPECSFLDCPGDWISHSFNKAMTYLFIPSETQRNNLLSSINSLKESFSSAFPFKYYFEIFDSFKNPISNVSSSDYTFSLNFLNKNIVVLSSSTIFNFLGSDNYFLLREYLGYCVYIASVLLVLSIL